jgi:hypothetical protein
VAPKPKPNPKAPAKTLIVTKESAARTQLETAIMLWFNYGDPISILALAAAANDCYDAMGAHIGAPSFFRAWLKTRSSAFQDQVRETQNFIKHGRMNLKGRVRYTPRVAEILMVDSIVCHENVFPRTTPLMRLYFARFALENPEIVVPERRPIFSKGADVDKLLNFDRLQFLEEFCHNSS